MFGRHPADALSGRFNEAQSLTFRFILVSERKLAKLQPLLEIIFRAGNGIIH